MQDNGVHMKDFDLCRELSRKLCKDLGATPFSITKAGLTHEDLRIQSDLKVQDENDVVKEVPMWYGEANGLEGRTCCLLAALDPDPDSLEIVCVIGFKTFDGEIQPGYTRTGFRYDWANDDDHGTLIMFAKDKCLEMSMSQRLQLALGFECMVQEGVLWNPQGKVPDEFRKNLSDIISLDENKET